MLRWVVQTCALSCRWRIKELLNWRPASTFWFTSALPEHTHAHTNTHSWSFQREIVWFFNTCDPGLAAHVRLSPGDHSSEARKSAVAPENSTRWLEPDWNKASESKGHARPHCWVEQAHYSAGINYLTKWTQWKTSLSLSLKKKKKKVWKRSLLHDNKKNSTTTTTSTPSRNNGTSEVEQPASKDGLMYGRIEICPLSLFNLPDALLGTGMNGLYVCVKRWGRATPTGKGNDCATNRESL